MSDQRILNRDEILSADDHEYTTVKVPEWSKDGVVKLRTMSSNQRDAFENAVYIRNKKGETTGKDYRQFSAKYCAACIVGVDNVPLFTEKDVELLGSRNAKALRRVFDEALTLNAFGKEEIDKLLKNSEPSPDEDSTTN